MSALVEMKANELLIPVDRGQSHVYSLSPTETAISAGQVVAIAPDGGIKVANGANIIAGTETAIGIAGDSFTDIMGSALYPSGGSGKITVWTGFGRYLTLTYDDGGTYTNGVKLYCDNNGLLTTDATGTRPPLAVVHLAPVIPAAVPVAIPEMLKGTRFGARREDAVRTMTNGTRRMFLGFEWIGQ